MAQQVFEQLPLSVQLKDDATFDNYYVADNAEAVSSLQKASVGLGEQCLYIWGEPGVGCSHLLQAACHQAESVNRNSVYLPLEELVEYSPAIFESLESLPLISLDNLHAIAGKPEWEEALFHLFNRVRDAGGCLILAGNVPLEELGIKLPDLLSRLNWGLLYPLSPLDEAGHLRAFQHRAHQRGLEISDDVARYVMNHVDSDDMAELQKTLSVLDRASLSAQRKLTKPFVKSVMGW